jgi:hypothetical protein
MEQPGTLDNSLGVDYPLTLTATEGSHVTAIRINPRLVVWALSVCASLLVVADLAGLILHWRFGHDYIFGLAQKFDLDQENNVPTWFSTICLFLCAIALSVIALAQRRRKGLSAYWFGLAATFVALSMDEAASFHELLVDPMRKLFDAGGLFFFAWVIPGGLFTLGYLLICWRFLGRLPAETRRNFLVAGFVFCAGCLGMEMIGGRYVALHGIDLNYGLLVVLEEGLEMAGEILFLRALLAYLANHVDAVTVGLRTR